jgi:hypothetical protein
MPNGSLTPKENINEINRILFDIVTIASRHPARGKDIAIIEQAKEIQAGPLFELTKYIEQQTTNK